jgi:hypothetical protein
MLVKRVGFLMCFSTCLSQTRTIQTIENRLDMENRATYMTVSIQQWLGARLDLSGNALILGIALFATGLRKTVDPSKVCVACEMYMVE